MNAGQEALQNRNDAMRAENEMRILGALRLAGNYGATQGELSDALGISKSTLHKRLNDLRARDLVHIGAWRVQGRNKSFAYVIGPGQDVPKPGPGDEERLEDEILAEVAQEHRRWAEQWKPCRDEAAAWI